MRFEINYNIVISDIMGKNLKDKKWMLKSYSGEKIMPIMKTMVDFVSVESNVNHCFSIWIHPWWCQMLSQFGPRQPV